MTVEVLLDTSYLISLVDANRPNHQTAAKYYRQMLNESLPMYFSAVAAVHARNNSVRGPESAGITACSTVRPWPVFAPPGDSGGPRARH